MSITKTFHTDCLMSENPRTCKRTLITDNVITLQSNHCPPSRTSHSLDDDYSFKTLRSNPRLMRTLSHFSDCLSISDSRLLPMDAALISPRSPYSFTRPADQFLLWIGLLSSFSRRVRSLFGLLDLENSVILF